MRDSGRSPRYIWEENIQERVPDLKAISHEMGQLTEFSALGGDECTTPFLRASSDFSNVSHHEKHRGRKRQHIIGVILSINICWSIALLYYSLAVDRTGSCLRDCECQNELTTCKSSDI